jgi:hypothetical protein
MIATDKTAGMPFMPKPSMESRCSPILLLLLLYNICKVPSGRFRPLPAKIDEEFLYLEETGAGGFGVRSTRKAERRLAPSVRPCLRLAQAFEKPGSGGEKD